MIPVYVVNLEADVAKLQNIRDQVAGYDFLNLIRVPGVDGTTLPSAACYPLTRNEWSVNHKGTLGCFLGHAHAWEIIAESEDPFSLCIEDDVRLYNLDILNGLRVPNGIDLVFCNDRTCYQPGGGVPSFLPLPPALAHAMTHGSIGSYGYLLTPAGARNLLDFVKQDSFFSHVDLRLFAYGITHAEADAIELPEFRIARDMCAVRRTYDAAHYIETRVLSPFLTEHVGGPDSRRAAADIPVLPC